jgi:hypothetical protein
MQALDEGVNMIDDYDSYKEYLFSDELLELNPEERQEAILLLLESNSTQDEIFEARDVLRFEPPAEWEGQFTFDSLNVAVKCAKSKLADGWNADSCVESKKCDSCTECPVVAFKKSPHTLPLSDYIALNSNDSDRIACMAICQHCSNLFFLTMRAINSLKVSAK